MDTLLVAVTGVSLALAAGMGVLLARMVREDRLRAGARVQLLEELAAEGHELERDRPAHPRPGDRQFSEAPRTKPAVVRNVPRAQPGGHDFSPASVTLHRTDLFHEDLEPSPWPRRFAVIGSLAGVLALGIFGWSQIRATSRAAVTSVAAAPASLELLSLRHAREGNTLTITGLVQNPAGAATLSNVQATVFVFGPGGTFLTSGRAPLDFTSLTPGDESPFVVRVPVGGEVARYRVGFRGPDDRVIGHVDHRTDQLGRNF